MTLSRTLLGAAAIVLSAAFDGAAAQTTEALTLEQAIQHPELLAFSDVLRVREGEVRITTGSVEPGAVLVSIPVAHRRTAVVEQDVGEGLGILVSPRVLVNGARGFWSGNFSPYAAETRGEAAWCFLDERERRTRSLCFVPRINAKAPASWSRDTLFLAGELSITTEVDNQWDTPLASERPVQIHDDLRLEYAFGRWRGRGAEIELRIGGSAYATLPSLSLGGAANIGTPVGNIVLQRPDERARTATVSLTPVAASSQQDRRERRMLSLPDLNARPIPVVRALTPVAVEAAPREVPPGAQLFAQDVVPAAAWGVEQRPDIVDERAPLGPFSTFRINGNDMVCALTPRPEGLDVTFFRLPNGRRATTSWEFCLEDADETAGYDVIRGFPGHPPGSNIGVWWVTGGQPVSQPLAPVAMDAAWTPETVRLNYITSDDERRTARGLRPRVAVFGLRLGEANRLQPDWWLLPVQLDEEGRGELRLGGRAVARIDGVALDGTARIQVLSGLPDAALPLLEPADFQQR